MISTGEIQEKDLDIDAIWWRDHGTWARPDALMRGVVEEVLPRL